jgi:L-asparaginase
MQLALITTGGTIAMGQEAGEARASWKFRAEDFARLLPLEAEDRLLAVDYSQFPSSHFDSAYAGRLATNIAETRARHDAVIITHGTDTLEETAFYLDMVLPPGKPVIVTGAMVTASQPGADGLANLRDAVLVAKSPATPGKGVLVVFNRDIVSAVHAIKQDCERLNAFGSIQTGKMGAVNGRKVFYYYGQRDHVRLKNETAGRAALVKLHYDIEPEFLQSAFRQADIVVIECLGSGRVQTKLVPVIDRNLNKFIVLTTRVPRGHLYDDYSYPGSFHDLIERGLIVSPLDSLKSCILAKLCFGNGKSHRETKEIFEGFWL